MCSTDKMAASSGSGQQILALRIKKGEHGRKLMSSLDGQSTLNDVFKKFHTFKENILKPSQKNAQFQCKIDLSPSTEPFEVGREMLIDEVCHLGVKVIEMACNLSKENKVETIISKCAQEATGKALNAFELLMTRGRAFVAPKETR